MAWGFGFGHEDQTETLKGRWDGAGWYWVSRFVSSNHYTVSREADPELQEMFEDSFVRSDWSRSTQCQIIWFGREEEFTAYMSR